VDLERGGGSSFLHQKGKGGPDGEEREGRPEDQSKEKGTSEKGTSSEN